MRRVRKTLSERDYSEDYLDSPSCAFFVERLRRETQKIWVKRLSWAKEHDLTQPAFVFTCVEGALRLPLTSREPQRLPSSVLVAGQRLFECRIAKGDAVTGFTFFE